jgi:hypothetical protein
LSFDDPIYPYAFPFVFFLGLPAGFGFFSGCKGEEPQKMEYTNFAKGASDSIDRNISDNCN